MSPSLVLARVRTHLALYDQNRALEERVHQRTAELRQTRLQLIQNLGRAAEYKDNETGLHVIRMSHYTQLLSQAHGMEKEAIDLLFHAAPMHDIGKIGIPDAVLCKPGKLDDEEWKIMRQHPQYGADIIGEHQNELLRLATIVALTHHEKWDGSGYPAGLAAEDIPLSGRIVAIADVFDALTSHRPYKKAWTSQRAFTLLEDERGKHFDPDLVDDFLSITEDVEAIKEKYAEETKK